MGFQTTPEGTTGARSMPSNPVTRMIMRLMTRYHRRSGDRFQGMNLLYLTTVGSKSGQRRQTTVAWFPDGDAAWLIVASAAGAAQHPAWYHNIAAHPDQVQIEIDGRELRVTPEQLDGQRRADALRRIASDQPRYGAYQDKTDRVLPVIRLTPA